MIKNATTNNTPVASENSPDAKGRVGLLTFTRIIYKFVRIIRAINNKNRKGDATLPYQFERQTTDSARLHKCSCIKQRLMPANRVKC
jgi:hypothetical protein